MMENIAWSLMIFLLLLLTVETVWRMVEKYKAKRKLEKTMKEFDEGLEKFLNNIKEQQKEKEEEVEGYE